MMKKIALGSVRSEIRPGAFSETKSSSEKIGGKGEDSIPFTF